MAVFVLRHVQVIMCCVLSSPPSGLQGCRRFQSSSSNYTTMLLEADIERLYVGARGAVFALNASDISASSALTVGLFVLCCCMFLISSSLPWLHLHSTTQELLRQQYFILRQTYLFPPPTLVCFSVCSHIVFTAITQSYTRGASSCIN